MTPFYLRDKARVLMLSTQVHLDLRFTSEFPKSSCLSWSSWTCIRPLVVGFVSKGHMLSPCFSALVSSFILFIFRAVSGAAFASRRGPVLLLPLILQPHKIIATPPQEKMASQQSTDGPDASPSQSSSTGSGGVPNKEAMDRFIKFMINAAENPPKTSELFKIPEGISPEWQAFFEKIAAHYERQCKDNRHALISLEKRSWILEDEKLSEFEMLTSATAMKETRYFHLSDPDAMNNMAACALKLNQYQITVDFATRALDMDLFTSPSTIAKAHFRRATAHLHLGKFADVLQNVTKAVSLNPGDASITALQEYISNTMKAVCPENLHAYLEMQPQPSKKMSFMEGMNWEQTNVQYVRIPK
ncbi:unnamed protein product [Cyclocybe aegerita]|uniref:peptidylprolyl isomerase n=1 Tax=Cyclocybe aegerita TaxID=1973307 RepID=A0A8S0WZD2_CYCAE|nr:unnamed protein product [Cyclocybe aegerita]